MRTIFTEELYLELIVFRKTWMGAIFAQKKGEGSSGYCLAHLNHSSKHPEHFFTKNFFFKRRNSHDNTRYAGAGSPFRGSEGGSVSSCKLFSRVWSALFIRKVFLQTQQLAIWERWRATVPHRGRRRSKIGCSLVRNWCSMCREKKINVEFQLVSMMCKVYVVSRRTMKQFFCPLCLRVLLSMVCAYVNWGRKLKK